MHQCLDSLGGCIGPTMSIANILNGIPINGIEPSGTFLTLPLQNLMMSWWRERDTDIETE